MVYSILCVPLLASFFSSLVGSVCCSKMESRINESDCSTHDVSTSPIEVFNLTMGEGTVKFLIDMEFDKIVGVGDMDSSLESSGTVGLHSVAGIFVGSCTRSKMSSPASAFGSSSSLLCSWGNAGRIGTAGSSFGFIENETGTGRNGYCLVNVYVFWKQVLSTGVFFHKYVLMELTNNLW